MGDIKCSLYDQETAQKDIKYCLDNAYSAYAIDLDKDNDMMFYRNPHFYLNSSDNVLEACRNNISYGDSVLTVAGSGDYMLEAVFRGATKVVNYDINSFQYYVLCLKMWAIEQLDYEEYINFLINFSGDYLDSNVFKKVISPYKKEDAYPFWYGFMNERRNEQLAVNELVHNRLIKMSLNLGSRKFPYYDLHYVVASEIGPQIMPERFRAIRLVQCAKASREAFSYIRSEGNYEFVKGRIKDVDISYIESNITELKDKVGEEKFDSIFVSNIPFYLQKDTTVKAIRDLLSLLKEDGKLSTYYQGMRISWFKSVLDMKDFKISIREFNTSSPALRLNMVGVSNSVLSHKELVESGENIILRDIPTYGGSPETRAQTDVLSLIKKK